MSQAVSLLPAADLAAQGIFYNGDPAAGSKAAVCDPVSDSLVLVDFYNTHNGPNWNNQQGWLTSGVMLVDWFGVSINGQGCVSSLEISDPAITGNLPDFNLPALEVLGITASHLQGTIPDFSHIPLLQYLNLSNNDLEGAVPDFSNLPNLLELDINTNQLTGQMPDFQYLPSLVLLDLSFNELTGTIPNFSMLPNLTELYLSANNITGPIPEWDIELPKLEFLGLAENALTGTVPDFQNFPFLRWLYLSDNRLEGPFPLLNQLDSLRVLATDNNQFTFEGLVYHYTQGYNEFSYSPQDSVFRDSLIVRYSGSDLDIDLGFDAGVTDNQYQWFKNGMPWTPPAPNLSNSNHLVFNPLGLDDAGEYWVEITNDGLPWLTLTSRKITLEVNAGDECLTVTHTGNAGGGSLREAIYCANQLPGPDTIRFNIPGPGPHIITPLSHLGYINDDGTVIDATTQPGWSPGRIVLDGSQLSGSSGLDVSYNSGFELYGLTIRFVKDLSGLGLYQCSNAIIGAPGKGNVFYGNHRQIPAGMHEITLQEVNNVLVQGNIFGTDHNFVIPNGYDPEIADIGMEGIGITIGGKKSQFEGNVFGNGFFGVYCYDDPANGFSPGNYRMWGNYFGISPGGQNISNGGEAGIGILAGVGPIDIGDGSADHENQFANLKYGVHVTGAGNQVLISRNSMSCNSIAGIERSDLQAPAVNSASSLLIGGVSLPGATIEVYRSSNAGCANVPCQGKDYLGTTTANGGGVWQLNAPFASPIQQGDLVTATATVASGNTSPFAACKTSCNPLSIAISGDSTLCAGESTQLTASGGSVYSWNGGPASASWPFTPAGTATYTVTVTDVFGCTGVASRQVVVSSLPNALAQAIDPEVCTGDTIRLQASGGTGYTWSGPGGFGASQDSPLRPNATTGMQGLYLVTVTNAAGCTATASATISVNEAPALSYESESAHCQQTNGAVDLSVAGSGPFQFVWNNGAFSEDLNNIGPGTYQVTVTDAQLCTASISAQVGSTGAPSLNIATSPMSSCVATNGSIDLTVVSGIPPFQFLWSNGSTSEDLGGLAAGNYSVTVTDGGQCTSQINGIVADSSPGTIETHINETICPGESVEFGGAGYSATGTYEQVISSVSGCDSIVTLVLSVHTPGTYSAVVDSFVLDQSAGLGLLDVGANDDWSDNDFSFSIIQDPVAGALEYISVGIVRYNLLQASFEGADRFSYALCSNVCPGICDTAEVLVVITQGVAGTLDRFLTNIITPEAQDGMNDLFDPVAVLLEQGFVVNEQNSSLDIYNRWGDLVLRTEAGGTRWDGRAANGQIVPSGTYYFILRADTGGPEPEVVTGSVVVWR